MVDLGAGLGPGGAASRFVTLDDLPADFITDDDEPLGEWVRAQSTGHSTLHPEQLQLVTGLGITLIEPAADEPPQPTGRAARQQRQLDQGLAAVAAFRGREGHLHIRQRDTITLDGDEYKVGQWLSNLRKRWDRLPPEHLQAVTEAGITATRSRPPGSSPQAPERSPVRQAPLSPTQLPQEGDAPAPCATHRRTTAAARPTPPPDASVIAAEDGLVHYLRQHAELVERGGYEIPADWSHQSQFHLLLALGRRHTPTPRPEGLTGMLGRLCYSNSAQYARDHQDEGLLYAEGFALTHVGLDFYLPHAWTVRPDGTVLDPTWDDEPGRVYVGIAVADSRLWPFDGGGILQDFDRLLPLLRDGFPPNALADRGRPLG